MDFERLDINQYTLLMLLFMLGTTILANVGGAVGADIWILYLLSMLVGLAASFMFYRLLKLHEFRSFPLIFENCFGYWGGKILCALYAIFYLVRTEIVGQTTTNMAGDLLMHDAPRRLTIMVLLFTTLYAVHKGLKAIGRSAEIIFPLLIICLLPFLMTAFASDAFTKDNLHPILVGGAREFWLRTGVVSMYPYSELPLLFGILAYRVDRNKQHSILNRLILANLTGTFILVGVGIINLSILGRHLVAALKYPFYNAMMLTGVHGVLERLDPLAVIIIVTSAFFKVVLLYYCYFEMLGAVYQGFKRNWLIIFTAILIMIASPDWQYLNDRFLDYILPFRIMPVFQIFIPVLMWLITEVKTYIRRKQTVAQL